MLIKVPTLEYVKKILDALLDGATGVDVLVCCNCYRHATVLAKELSERFMGTMSRYFDESVVNLVSYGNKVVITSTNKIDIVKKYNSGDVILCTYTMPQEKIDAIIKAVSK